MTVSSALLTRVLDNAPGALLSSRGYFPAASPRGAAFITGYGQRAGITFPLTRETGERAEYRLTLAGQPFTAGRGQQAFDMVTPNGLPVAVKGKVGGGRRHAVDLGLGAAWEALVACVSAGLPAIVVEVRGDVDPASIPAGGVGDVAVPDGLAFTVYNVADAILSAPLVVKAGRGHKGLVWLRPDRAYTRLRLQLDEVTPLAAGLDLDGLDAALRDLDGLVTWRRVDRHAIAQWAGVRLFHNGVVRVDGREVCTLRAKEAAALAAILKGKGEPVKVACRTTASTLRKGLKAGGVTLASTYGKGLTVAR